MTVEIARQTSRRAVLLTYGEPAIFASPEEAEAHVRACWGYPDEFADVDIHGVDFLDVICGGENAEPWAWVEALGDNWLAPDGTLWRVDGDGIAKIIANDHITPRVAPENIHAVVKEYYGRQDGVDLDNGVYVRLHGDGTGQGDDGRAYIAISRELENDDYELLGYADINDTEA